MPISTSPYKLRYDLIVERPHGGSHTVMETSEDLEHIQDMREVYRHDLVLGKMTLSIFRTEINGSGVVMGRERLS